MNTIWIVALEPIDQRYTAQWYHGIPKDLNDLIAQRSLEDRIRVVTIGDETPSSTTKGAFLDFATTNEYKSKQVATISEHFAAGKIKPRDKFLVTDAWNFSITAIKYMSELFEIPVEIHSIWHAGSYDPTDILGMKMNKSWSYPQEIAWFNASTHNYFGTQYHRSIFMRNLGVKNIEKAHISGQPHKMLLDQIADVYSVEKENLIVWPHRYNADKNPGYAELLAEECENLGYEFVFTQKLKLSKPDYYNLLNRAKVVFSCASHENLGISIMEGTLLGALPLVPYSNSYMEMYISNFTYSANLIKNHEHFKEFGMDQIINRIKDMVEKYDSYSSELEEQQSFLKKNYLSAKTMYNKLLEL